MEKKAEWLHVTIIVLSILFILFLTLFPFNFIFQEEPFESDHKFYVLKWRTLNARDTSLNILLFFPLGFSFSSYLMQKKKSGLSTLGWILLISFGLSYSIEVLQFFQPWRSPSMNDVTANSLGGILGYFILRWKQSV